MLAFGGGSVKKNGAYDEMKDLLSRAGKKVVGFYAPASVRPKQVPLALRIAVGDFKWPNAVTIAAAGRE